MSDLFTAENPKPKAKRTPKPEPVIESTAEQSVGALVEQTQANPVAVFTDKAKFNEFAAKLKAETDKHVPDVTTQKGRDAIRSLSFKVTKAKTTLVAAGKGLTEDWRTKIALVNASRNEMETELDNLAKSVRAPLTEWEAGEDARFAANSETLAMIRNSTVIADDDTSATVEDRGRDIYALTFDPPQWNDDEIEAAQSAQKTAVASLFAARNRLAKEEADAAELAELRRKQAERDEADRLADIAKAEAEAAKIAEQERLAQIEADKAAETARVAADAEKLATAQREAAEQAKRDAEALAQAERDKAQAAFESALQAEKDRAAEAEAKAKANQLAADIKRAAEDAEQKRIHDAELQEARNLAAEIEAAAKKAADAVEAQRVADAKAAKDRSHVAAVMGAAKTAIMSCGVEEGIARMIVLAIKAGTVPAVTISFRKAEDE